MTAPYYLGRTGGELLSLTRSILWISPVRHLADNPSHRYGKGIIASTFGSRAEGVGLSGG